MWGIEETAWVASLFPLLRWKIWLRMLQLTAGQMLTTTVVPPWLILLFPQMWGRCSLRCRRVPSPSRWGCHC